MSFNYFTLMKDISTKVYKSLGAGYHETIYQRAICNELIKTVPFEFERVIPVFHDNLFVGNIRADIVINNKFIAELKATSRPPGFPEKYQLSKYLENLKINQGMVINFPQPSVSSEANVLKGIPQFLEIDLNNTLQKSPKETMEETFEKNST